MSLSSRQRLDATLNHTSPDRVCIDFGATHVTGINVSVVTELRRALLGDNDYRVKVTEPYQMLGFMEEDLLAFDYVMINGGQRGIMVKMKPEDIKKALGCRLARISDG